MIITVFKNLYDSKGGRHVVDIDKVAQRIRVGKSKDVVERIRSAKTTELKTSLKNSLPSILFAGEFTERNGKGLVNHSGLMVLDFDKYPDAETMNESRKMIIQNKHIVLLFTSPSGNGLKAVVRIPKATKETHPKYFKAFYSEFNYDYFDISNSNVDRVCFESYDPEIYINYEAEVFNPVIIDEGYSVKERPPVLQITDEDKIISKIMSFKWQKDFKEGERNNFLFNISSAFCEYGVSQSSAEGYILNNVVYGDFPEREALNTIKSAYRLRSFGSKYFEDYPKIDRIKSELHKGKEKVISKFGISEDVFDEIKEAVEHDDFWYLEENKKGEKVCIDVLKYKLFLERNGFKKFFPHDTQKPTWVQVTSNKVCETSVEKIKDFVLNYLMERGVHKVWSYCASYPTLFSEQFLLMLSTVELMMLKDTKHKSFIAFDNGILEVTANEYNLIDYIDVDGYVWQSHIIPRNFKESDTDNEYKQFVYNISNGEPLAIECVIGYLISSYKNKMNNKAIILNDEVISENPEGGTGKGLLVQGIRQIRRVSILDGKTFDDKKSFPYQTVSPETQVLVFDDVKKNFDFESKFSLVTEGMTLERKNKDAIRLKVEDSPKMVISTNYAIKGEGNSHDRRRFEVEIAQYYGKKKTPYDEFGRQLFDDWTADEFASFDNYMVHCLQMYLKNGLVAQNAKNIKMRKFIAETSMEFYEWINDRSNAAINERLDKQTYFNNFTDEYQDFKRWLTRKKFNIWVQKYCSFANFEYKEGNTNGNRWFMISDGGEPDDDIAF